MVGGKMFAMCCGDNDGKPIITMKHAPTEGDILRRKHKDIVTGYYTNKEHWNSLYLEGDVPDDVLKNMICESHQRILKSLSKKLQKK
jgi:predicted DNA-binding protein (MmcQ/YjbR family)